jgi:hypothetical protein
VAALWPVAQEALQGFENAPAPRHNQWYLVPTVARPLNYLTACFSRKWGYGARSCRYIRYTPSVALWATLSAKYPVPSVASFRPAPTCSTLPPHGACGKRPRGFEIASAVWQA